VEGLFVENFAWEWNCKNFQFRNFHGLYITRPEIHFSAETNLLANSFSFTVTRHRKPLSRPMTRKMYRYKSNCISCHFKVVVKSRALQLCIFILFEF
jgi:hypothetical protein